VQRVARRIFRSDNLAMAVVGPEMDAEGLRATLRL
jgi:hypothetical protein